MTLEKLQELVNNEEIIYVVQDSKIWRIHTQKDYEATTHGLDNGQRLVPFEPTNAYETAVVAVLAYAKKHNTDIDLKEGENQMTAKTKVKFNVICNDDVVHTTTLAEACKYIRQQTKTSQLNFATIIHSNQTEISFIERGFIPNDPVKINFIFDLYKNLKKKEQEKTLEKYIMSKREKENYKHDR